jgi:hypothetical protein
MEQKLQFFRTISKKFIFFWCLLVLGLTAILNFPTLLQKGLSLLQAEEGELYIIRSYPECAGEPGMVHDVDAMSDGTYRTYNQHYQFGVCGDILSTPEPTPTPQAYVVRSYPECAGAPGRVRDVDAISDGSYKTYNEHYQAGACGDTPSPAPVQSPVVQPAQPVTTEEYQCEGGNKVYYRVYINIVRPPEKTGRIDYNSPNCGSPAHSRSQGSTFEAHNQNFSNYPTLSASCVASPSQSRVGESVSWQVLTTGGSGSFKYRWSGDESLHKKDDRTFQVTYQSPGVRTAQVEVIDRNTDQKTTTSCLVTVSATSTPILTQQPVSFYNLNQIAMMATPTPYPTVTPTPVVQTQVINAPVAQCPAGTTEKSRSSTQLICERPTQAITTVTATNKAQCPSGTIERSRSGGILQCEQQVNQATLVVLAAASPQPVQTIVTSATTQTAVQCPTGTIEKSRSSAQLICERQLALETKTAVVQSTDQPAVKVLGTETSSIRELPRTGLPLAAVAVSALAPVGWKVRQLIGAKVEEESAQDIWLGRQLQR